MSNLSDLVDIFDETAVVDRSGKAVVGALLGTAADLSGASWTGGNCGRYGGLGLDPDPDCAAMKHVVIEAQDEWQKIGR